MNDQSRISHTAAKGQPASPAAASPADRHGLPRLSFKKRVQSLLMMTVGTLIVRALGISYRFRLWHRTRPMSLEEAEQRLTHFRGDDGGPLLFALWHAGHLPVLYRWRRRGVCVITSRSADGMMLARLLRRLGFRTVHGSSSRGGSRALIDMARAVRDGADAAVAVDGPRGPALKVKPGIILLAKRTGRPIVPIATTARRYWRFQSWDRFRMPLPLTRVVVAADDPLYVPADADHERIERVRAQLEQRMLQLQASIDEAVKPRVWQWPRRRAQSSRVTR